MAAERYANERASPATLAGGTPPYPYQMALANNASTLALQEFILYSMIRIGMSVPWTRSW